MPTSRLPLDIKEFLTEHIDSFVQLEILFLLLEQPGTKWSVQKLCQELRSNATIVGKHLQHLCASDIITKHEDDTYSYLPKPKFEAIVNKTHEIHKAMPVSVIAFLYEKPQDKLKSFADAFKFKKD